MLGLLTKLAYPVFGILVLIGYLRVVRGGIEPFEADSERHAIASASQRGTGGGTHYRAPSVFFFGGHGGK